MTISKNKYVSYSILTILLLLLLSNLYVVIGCVFADDIAEYVVFSSLSVLLTIAAIVLLFVMYRRDKKDVVRDNYIANIVHDCKTPITTINIVSQTLNDIDVDSEETLRYYSDIIKTETSKLIVMIENVLNLIRLHNVRLDYNQIVDVHQVIDDSLKSMKFLVKNLGGEIVVHLDSNNHYVRGNYDIFLSIIINLISNAVKYSKSSPMITINTKDIGDNVEISVIDNGIGMEESELDSIFEKTYRISSSRDDVEGSGVGLYYVKENVERLNGRIKVFSRYGNGSEFRIALPIV